MTDKLQKRIREVEEDHAGEVVEQHLEQHRQQSRDRALLIAGGFKAALKISAAISSEVMRSMEVFQEERLYMSFGYERFATFLDESEFSPMSKSQYYERKSILEKEGDRMFDVFGELGLSIRKRKLLGKGNVEIDGDSVIILDGDERTEIELKDRSRLIETLTALADANAEKSIKLERQKEKIEKHADEKRDLYDEIDRVRASKVAPHPDDHMIARVELGLAFSRLRENAAGLSEIEKDQFRDSVLEDVAGWTADLREAYKTGTAKAKPAAASAIVGDTFAEAFTNFLETVDDDIDGEDNDGELAAQL